ncbi:HRDC domain-containing protein, partial [Nostoc ellipsosporum NOK]|nr:HRDC domain-containing protein [Nostoc ellipsosporum NOK]
AHAGLPKSIEAYYQETGRAGRDGDPAVAHLFWGAEDFARARQRIGEVEAHRQPGERARLNALGALVETAGCRRRILLAHFGEEAPAACGNCDNCLAPPKAIDATETARKYLSAVFRTGQMFGSTYVEQVLTGKSTERSLINGHESLSVWGIVDGEETILLKPVGRALQLRDALRANPHGGLEFGPAARAILKGEEPVALVLPPKRERRRKGEAAANPVGDPLFEALRAKRRDLAREAQVPPYVIFHDSVLREMAASRPTSIAQMAGIAGVGQRKLDAYGEAFLRVIHEN